MMNPVINLDELLAILAMAAILGNALAVGAAVLLTRRFADLEAAVDRLGRTDALPDAFDDSPDAPQAQARGFGGRGG